jgi:hypothetical protein
MQAPSYRNKPIGTVQSLAKALQVSIGQLLRCAELADDCYIPNEPERKPNGTTRQTYRVRQPLYSIQTGILDQILRQVDFPCYLQGSIRDVNAPRDYIVDASLHVGQYVVIQDDISDFFPSIKAARVHDMWKYLFKFSEEVASLLTRLTTYHGFVPQGAQTSSYIGNLILWDKEPHLVEELEGCGFRYTRYVDDINISADRRLGQAELHLITSEVYAMMHSAGVRPNRIKRNVMTIADRVSVHNLNLNAGMLTLTKEERNKIRAAVRQYEEMVREVQSSIEIESCYKSILGRVATMERLHPSLARRYKKRLQTVRPA